VLDDLFERPAFLNEFIPEPETAEKASWVFGDHLSERIKIHRPLAEETMCILTLRE
jgi:hypothetical protein